MNLFDLVKRNDRGIEVLTGDCLFELHTFEKQLRRCVRVPAGSKIKIRNASDFSFLSERSNCFGWKIRTTDKKRVFKNKQFTFTLSAIADNVKKKLCALELQSGEWKNLEVNWPPIFIDFDLLIETEGDVLIDVGANYSAKGTLLKMLSGFGVEVGAGLNPSVKPSSCLSVHYLEETPLLKWSEKYGDNDNSLTKIQNEGLSQFYKVGSATDIEYLYGNESLDFIFSNHVFEHLNNPIRVLEIWSKKIKSGGVVLGVIPDYRYCFDLRQKPSEPSDWLLEYGNNVNEVSDCKIEKWIKYTSPDSDMESIRKRAYSIHVHFYSPRVFLNLAELVINMKLFSKINVFSGVNSKDFGFVLVK